MQTIVDVVDATGMGDRQTDRYLDYLTSQIRPYRERSFRELYELMLAKEFVWFVPNDDNRIDDGLEIRCEFFHRDDALKIGCSVLEVIIGLSRRIAFIVGGSPDHWAWELITNLELHRMSGHIGRKRANEIDEILERLIWRTYEPDGCGGLFPLAWPPADMRQIELWYQMSAWIEELPDL